MLEILVLIKVTQSLANTCRMKSRSTGWSALFPLFWIGGEITGFIVASSHRHYTGDDFDMGAYGYAILGAILGGVLAYVIVKSLKDLTPPPIAPARML
jgi:hypothetical protein